MTGHEKLDALRRETGTMLRAVASEAERLARVGSIKLKVSTLQGEIRDYQGELGAWMCAHRAAAPDDAEVTALLGKIDSLMAEVEEQRRALAEVMRPHGQP